MSNLRTTAFSTVSVVPAKRKVSSQYADFQRTTRVYTGLQKAPREYTSLRNGRGKPDFALSARDSHAAAPHETDDHLCDRCRNIDFSSIFNLLPDLVVTEKGQSVHQIKSPSTFSNEIQCHLCKLFALVADRNKEYENYHCTSSGNWSLVAFTTSSLWGTPYALMARTQQLSIVLTMEPVRKDNYRDNRTLSMERGVILPYQDSMTSDLKHSVKFVAARSLRRVDFERIKTFLSNCDLDHPKCSKRNKEAIKFPVEAKVINCENRKLVPLTSANKYVALNHVWGSKKQGSSQLSRNGPKLTSQLPQTIESAIAATKALGFQFLWVDRYCIDQGHSNDIQHQIKQMANIYSHAVVTICALGEHDEVNLPGVMVDRKKQLSVRTRNMTLTWTGPSIQRKLRHSKWSSRGWTYQESVLSRRCIFFIDYYAALLCTTKVSVENVIHDNAPVWSFKKDTQIWGEEESLGRPLYPAQEFFKHMGEFRKRQLSFAMDTLSAFKGILSQLEVQSYWGIPIYKVTSSQKDDTRISHEQKQETGFLAGLCWEIEKERPGSKLSLAMASSPPLGSLDSLDFPSWSWTGWDRPITSNYIADPRELEVAAARFSKFKAKVAVRGLDSESISFEEFVKQNPDSKVIPEQTRFLELTSLVLTWKRAAGDHDEFVARPRQTHPWWKYQTLGDLHLDANSTNKNQHGHAILLAHSELPYGRGVSIRTVWLVLKLMADNTFRRRGMIVFNPKEMLDPLNSPPEGMLETIVLG